MHHARLDSSGYVVASTAPALVHRPHESCLSISAGSLGGEVKRRKDPPGYIGDTAVRELTEELMERLRQKTGSDITPAELEQQIKERRSTDPKLRLMPKALALRLRAVREIRGMTRKQLSEAA